MVAYVSHPLPQPTDLAPRFRPPRAEDGAEIWRLIEASGALDTNSLYCNLLQCTDFADTCTVVEDERVIGWMSAYIPPSRPDTLFVWQVCTAPAARGMGLARRMIREVLARPACSDVRQVECTITRANAPSWGLFRALARDLDAPLQSSLRFARDTHLDGRHDSEMRVAIGPINTGDTL